MKFKEIIFSLILFPLICIHPQEVNAGFRIESLSFTTFSDDSPSLVLFPSIYGKLGINLFENYNLNIRGGFAYGPNYFIGGEIGLYLQYNIYKDKLYAITGINLHSNAGGPQSIETEVYEQLYKLYGLGLGCRINRIFILELIYYKVSPEELIYNPSSNSTKEEIISTIKLGFGFEWNL